MRYHHIAHCNGQEYRGAKRQDAVSAALDVNGDAPVVLMYHTDMTFIDDAGNKVPAPIVQVDHRPSVRYWRAISRGAHVLVALCEAGSPQDGFEDEPMTYASSGVFR